MKSLNLIFLLFLGTVLQAQIPVSLNVSTFTNPNYGNVEPAQSYNFGYPIYADILDQDPNTYSPEYSNRYFMSIYGPRHKSVNTSNIDYFDFHKGSDMTADVSYQGNDYDKDNAPDIHCMCDGVVDEIFTGPNPESTGTGMYVTVKCDSSFKANPNWGNVYTAYRHLASITNGLAEGDSIDKGDVVGEMGATGHTTTVHLHFSVIRKNESSQINVHPMRLFHPDSIPHLLQRLTQAEFTQLEHSANEALFRIAIPYNMANIRAVEVSLPGGSYQKTYDFEEVSQLSEEVRDDNNSVDGLELFAYPFNRGHNCYRRVWDRYEEGKLPDHYPASPLKGVGNFYPFLSEGLHQTPSYVLDLLVKDLPGGYNIEDLNIKVIDIWGNGVEANGTTQAADEHFAWAMIGDEDDDAEEHQNGTMDLESSDLELVYDGYTKGNQTVGLLFRDLAIPSNSTITSAFVQFRADESHSDNTNLHIHADDSGNSADITSDPSDLSSRETTYAESTWQPSAWTIDEMGSAQKWTGLAPLVQEVVTRNDWTVNSPFTLLITGNGRRQAEGYSSNDLWKNSYVYVEYNDDVASAPNEPPVVSLTAPLDGTELQSPSLIQLSATASDQNNNLDYLEFYVNDVLVGTDNSAPFEMDYQIPDFGSYDVHTIAVDTEGLMTFSETASVSVTDNVLDIQISEGDDDVEQLGNGVIWKSNSDLELCYDDLVHGTHGLIGHQYIGLRFQNITIPQGATITNAYIQFTADETDSDFTEIIIRGEDIGNAPEFGYSANNVSTRNMTNDSIEWTPAAWNNTGEAGTDQRTPNISSLIQTITDRGDWASGNDLVLILYSWDQLKRVAESYNGSPNEAPILHLEYSTNNSSKLSKPENTLNNGFSMYPNPVVPNGRLTLSLEEMGPVNGTIAIYNNAGQVLTRESISFTDQLDLTIKVPNYPAGLYWVSIQTPKGIYTKKLVITYQ